MLTLSDGRSTILCSRREFLPDRRRPGDLGVHAGRIVLDGHGG